MIAIDHIGILSRDPASSARFLTEILGLAPPSPAGPDGDIFRIEIDGSPTLLYFPTEAVLGQHLAFRVDEATFTALVDRLRSRNLVFGNAPEAQTNLQSSDPHGSLGRVFFRDPNNHLFEVMA